LVVQLYGSLPRDNNDSDRHRELREKLPHDRPHPSLDLVSLHRIAGPPRDTDTDAQVTVLSVRPADRQRAGGHTAPRREHTIEPAFQHPLRAQAVPPHRTKKAADAALCCQTLSALSPSLLDHQTATAARHAIQEAMQLLATPNFRLKSALHP
jgi:hypothetical protein